MARNGLSSTNNHVKAGRLLAAGAVKIGKVERHAKDGKLSAVYADVDGDTGKRTVRYSQPHQAPSGGPLVGGWKCDCPAQGLCSHITAIALVCGTE